MKSMVSCNISQWIFPGGAKKVPQQSIDGARAAGSRRTGLLRKVSLVHPDIV